MALNIEIFIQTAAKPARGSAGRVAPKGAVGNHSHLLRWLMSLGGLGIFLVAIVDSSVIPIPLPGSTDLLLLLLTSHRGSTGGSAAWLALCALSGSVIGGYLSWSVGRKGGEAALVRYVPARFLERITGWMKTHGAWSLGVATILPPPVPLMPFVVASGALGVSWWRFLAFYGLGRALRYGFLAWVGVTYGRRMVRVWLASLGGWSTALLWAYCSLVGIGAVYGIWKFRRAKQAGDAPGRAATDLA